MKYLLFIFSFILMFCLISREAQASWLIYHKPAYDGQIMDIETKQPIEGAVVVVFYYKRPIIGLGAGGSPSIMKIKEALTDKEGKFHIPSYTTIIQPFSLESHIEFLIYKPGYANAGALEKNFSKNEIPDEYSWFPNTSKKISIHNKIIELPRLETKEDRMNALQDVIGAEPYPAYPIKYQNLTTQVINEEHRFLAYKSFREKFK